MIDFIQRAKDYCQSRNLDLTEGDQLGYGADGRVWKTKVGTALKAFERLYNYEDELECYRRLEAHGIRELVDSRFLGWKATAMNYSSSR